MKIKEILEQIQKINTEKFEWTKSKNPRPSTLAKAEYNHIKREMKKIDRILRKSNDEKIVKYREIMNSYYKERLHSFGAIYEIDKLRSTPIRAKKAMKIDESTRLMQINGIKEVERRLALIENRFRNKNLNIALGNIKVNDLNGNPISLRSKLYELHKLTDNDEYFADLETSLHNDLDALENTSKKVDVASIIRTPKYTISENNDMDDDEDFYFEEGKNDEIYYVENQSFKWIDIYINISDYNVLEGIGLPKREITRQELRALIQYIKKNFKHSKVDINKVEKDLLKYVKKTNTSQSRTSRSTNNKSKRPNSNRTVNRSHVKRYSGKRQPSKKSK